MRYWITFIWHRITCTVCYDWTPIPYHQSDKGYGLGLAFLVYFIVIILLGLLTAALGNILW